MDQCQKWVCEPGVTGHTCLNPMPCLIHQPTFRILWPNVGRMTAERIGVLYSDAVANGDIDDDDKGLTDPYLQAKALDNAGLITLGKD